jgi:hypothetical protein
MGRLLDTMRRARAERTYDVRTCDKSDISDQSGGIIGTKGDFGRLSRFCRNSLESGSRPPQTSEPTSGRLRHILDTLDSRCPDHVEHHRWRQAVDDGGRFLATWGAHALVLGWTARELLGLHQPPENPHPSYRRLSRYDETGLIWLLEGREVVELTEETAAIRWPGGSITTYRKNNKPALGPLGDSLDNFE